MDASYVLSIIGEFVMKTGTVKWFNTEKGFGFIQQDDSKQDMFVHASALRDAGLQGLDDGQRVSYEIEDNRGRQAAVNLQLV